MDVELKPVARNILVLRYLTVAMLEPIVGDSVPASPPWPLTEMALVVGGSEGALNHRPAGDDQRRAGPPGPAARGARGDGPPAGDRRREAREGDRRACGALVRDPGPPRPGDPRRARLSPAAGREPQGRGDGLARRVPAVPRRRRGRPAGGGDPGAHLAPETDRGRGARPGRGPDRVGGRRGRAGPGDARPRVRARRLGGARRARGARAGQPAGRVRRLGGLAFRRAVPSACRSSRRRRRPTGRSGGTGRCSGPGLRSTRATWSPPISSWRRSRTTPAGRTGRRRSSTPRRSRRPGSA